MTNSDLVGFAPGRARPAVRAAYARPLLTTNRLAAPMLIHPDASQASAALPGLVSAGKAAEYACRLADLGVGGVKIFATDAAGDVSGSGALDPCGPMADAIYAVKAAAPLLMVTTEVCGCAWTPDHECVLTHNPSGTSASPAQMQTQTLDYLGRVAVLHANAGADQVSPTAMLPGAVSAVRRALDVAGHFGVSVNPNIAIHSTLYQAFKTAMGTDPARGHRRGWQLEPDDAVRQGVACGLAWVAEGADALTVQPALGNVDLIAALSAAVSVPITAYSVSGEYTALSALGPEGSAEYHLGLARAGADVVLSFDAATVAAGLTRGNQ
jgi:porphobilinogen synthase